MRLVPHWGPIGVWWESNYYQRFLPEIWVQLVGLGWSPIGVGWGGLDLVGVGWVSTGLQWTPAAPGWISNGVAGLQWGGWTPMESN